MAVYNSILEVIGNTPLLKLDSNKTGLKHIEVYVKLEYLNPFGSLKDRTALAMLEDSLSSAAENSQEYIEASSGNTIKAMQAIAGLSGISTTSVTNRIRIPEIKDILLAMGANIVEVPGKSSCIDPSNPEDPLYIIESMMREKPDHYIYPNQYYNEKNPAIHHDTTGEEIAQDLGPVDYFFATLGTTGSSQGVLKRLKQDNSDLIAIGVAAAQDDFIPGIRNQNDLMDVGIYDRSLYTDVIYEKSSVAIDAMLDLIRNHGVMAGPTSGVVYAVALQELKILDQPSTKIRKAVIIVCDRMEWYISYLKERRPEIFKLEPKPNSIHAFELNPDDCKTIESSKAPEFIQAHDPLIIDTRSNLAYRAGHIPHSINITDTFLEEIVDGRRPFPKQKKILIACVRGNASRRVVGYLRNQGYDAFNLEGGILEWKQNQFSLSKDL